MGNSPAASAAPYFSRSLDWAGYLLGFSLGGFFDGILLHQILQWHHLLLGVKDPAFQNIEVQILADGLFHMLMYVLALVGLWLLWKSRHAFSTPLADRWLVANAFLGFGVWHILDSILSHWILGIHRIRMDVDNVLFWDLLWFVVFGIAFAAIGWLLRKRTSAIIPGSSVRSSVVAMLLALAVAIAGPIAALPPANVTTVMVFFRPGTAPVEIFKGIDAVDGRIIWAGGNGNVWALDIKEQAKAPMLYKHGAYLVSNSAIAIGCLAWTRASS